MKYFTPERCLRLGNLDDEAAFLAAQEEWEKALSDYREQLQRIRQTLPPDLSKMVESVYLHDAPVLAMYKNENTFSITLQPPSDPERLAVFDYSLVEEPTIVQDVLPLEWRREPIQWLYDELDLDWPEKPCGLPVLSDKPTMRHNILLSNGWEVTLHFRSAQVKRPIRLIPVVSEPADSPAAESRSA